MLLLFVGLLLAIAGAWFAMHPKRLDIHVGLDAPGGHLQVFPHLGGYSEITSRQTPLEGGGVHDYPLRLQAPKLPKVVRIDPGNARGAIDLQYIAFSDGHRKARIEGSRLRKAITLRHDLAWASPTGNLTAIGEDPWFEIAVPDDMLASSRSMRHAGWAACALGLLFGIGVMGFHARRIANVIHAAMRKRSWLWPPVAIAIAGIAILSVLGLPPGGLLQDPLRGLRYGAQLFLAAALLSVIGAVLLDLLGLSSRIPRFSRLFLWLTMGQCGLVAYLYLRSLLCSVGIAPVGAWEVWSIAALCGYRLWHGQRRRGSALPCRGLAMQLGMLAAICLVIADRELPRAVMLSSDPDTHAFLSRQILDLGFLPWSGDQVFDYPGGSAFLGAIWSWLSGLDPRNTITALPLIACFTGALLLAEAIAQRHPRPDAHAASLLTALALTAAAFLFPVVIQYAHMEGAGRQISFMFAAALPALWLGSDQGSVRAGKAIIVPAALVLLALAALNPIGPVMPGIVLGAFWLNASLRDKRFHPSLLAAPLAVLLLLLDPYYQGLFTGAGSNPKITVIAGYEALSGTEILANWPGYYLRWRELASLLFRLLPWHPLPTFALLLIAVGLPALLLGKRTFPARVVLSAIALVVVLLACAGLFFTLRTDPRGYLLADYFDFSITQYKAILLVLLASTAASAAITRGWTWRTLVIAGMGTVIIALGMRTQQEIMAGPRHAYCGSLGCVSENDKAVLEMMRKAMPRNSTREKVLLPNMFHRSSRELWVFPVAGARALPFSGTLEPAFFYYQGDKDFTSQAYMDNVCRQFNRSWLLQHRIGYIFLPESRASACIRGMESLTKSEKVIFHVGNAYLLRISTGSATPPQASPVP